MKKISVQGKHKIPIHKIHKIVHEGPDRGISAISTLARYGVSSRAYYTQCKINGLPNWSELNKKNILVRKRIRPQKRELSGGSLEVSEDDDTHLEKRVSFKNQKIESLKKNLEN